MSAPQWSRSEDGVEFPSWQGEGPRVLDFKLEYQSPTGSFKDRGASMLIAAALAEGATEFVEDSSGNAGAAMASYGAAAGLRAHIFVPASASGVKMAQIEAYGAEVHVVSGGRASASVAARRYSQVHGLPYLSHSLSPYFAEGMKVVASEVAAQRLADAIVLPVGNGSLLLGLRRGFEELERLERLGRLERLEERPRLYAVQAQSVAPLVWAVEGRRARSARPTMADGAAVADPPRLGEMRSALEWSGGGAVSVTEFEIGYAQALLSRGGLYVEPTAALGLAGLPRLMARGEVGYWERVLMPLTGTGLKAPG